MCPSYLKALALTYKLSLINNHFCNQLSMHLPVHVCVWICAVKLKLSIMSRKKSPSLEKRDTMSYLLLCKLADSNNCNGYVCVYIAWKCCYAVLEKTRFENVFFLMKTLTADYFVNGLNQGVVSAVIFSRGLKVHVRLDCTSLSQTQNFTKITNFWHENKLSCEAKIESTSQGVATRCL